MVLGLTLSEGLACWLAGPAAARPLEAAMDGRHFTHTHTHCIRWLLTVHSVYWHCRTCTAVNTRKLQWTTKAEESTMTTTTTTRHRATTSTRYWHFAFGTM